MSDHAYNPNCGCPGCQFLLGAENVYHRCGPPLKIGEFTPIAADVAEDPRYPGFFRQWTGDRWYPTLRRDEPTCICARAEHHSRYGCFVDDSTLPKPKPISQEEAMKQRMAASL